MEQQHNQGQPPYVADDEIDLFELVETVWKGKWIIVAVVCCALLFAGVFVTIRPTVYEVKIPFNINYSSVDAYQVCGGNPKCLMDSSVSSVAAVASMAVVTDKNQSNFVFNGMDEDLLANVTTHLNDAIEKATVRVIREAENEILTIQTRLPSQLLATERVANNYLNSLRIIQMAEDESLKILSIKKGIQTVRSPKIVLTFALASVAGLMLGAMIVLVRQAIINRRERSFVKTQTGADTAG